MFKVITAMDRVNYLTAAFINYYRRFFNVDEFYFMVHYRRQDEIKAALKSYGFTENQMETYIQDKFGWGDNVHNQNRLKTKFLQEGYIVIYADPDEFIFHPNLREYIVANLVNWIVPTGISLMQHSSETPLDKTKKILEQRDYCKIDTYWFSKTCILKKDYEWLAGRHTKPVHAAISSDIYLVDVGKMCKDFMLENNAESRNIYNKVFWRYSTDKKDIFNQVFAEHKGSLEKLPSIIKEHSLF